MGCISSTEHNMVIASISAATTSNHVVGYTDNSDFCGYAISECNHLKRLQVSLNKYYNDEQKYQADLNLNDILNDFLHLMHAHNDNVEFIAEYLNSCNLLTCEIFRRKLKNMYPSPENRTSCDEHGILQQMIDKIHCYFQHTQHDSYSKIRSKPHEPHDDITTENATNILNNICESSNENKSFFDYISIENKTNPKLQKNAYNITAARGNRFCQLFENTNQTENQPKQNIFFCFGYNFLYGYPNEDMWGMQKKNSI
eukprot:27647_1